MGTIGEAVQAMAQGHRAGTERDISATELQRGHVVVAVAAGKRVGVIVGHVQTSGGTVHVTATAPHNGRQYRFAADGPARVYVPTALHLWHLRTSDAPGMRSPIPAPGDLGTDSHTGMLVPVRVVRVDYAHSRVTVEATATRSTPGAPVRGTTWETSVNFVTLRTHHGQPRRGRGAARTGVYGFGRTTGEALPIVELCTVGECTRIAGHMPHTGHGAA